MGTEVGVGLILTYVPYVDEIPVGERGLLFHFGCCFAVVGVTAGGSPSIFLGAAHVGFVTRLDVPVGIGYYTFIAMG